VGRGTRAAGHVEDDAGAAAGGDASDGCAAHGGVDAGLPRARAGRTHTRGGTGAGRPADRCAALDALLLVSLQPRGRRIELATADESVAGHFLHLLHGLPADAESVRAMHTSLILYAEHEFNAYTFTARVIAGTGSDLHSCI